MNDEEKMLLELTSKLTELEASLTNLNDTLDRVEVSLNDKISNEVYENDKKSVLYEKERFIADIREMKNDIRILKEEPNTKRARFLDSIGGKLITALFNIVMALLSLGFVSWIGGLIE